MVRRFLMGNEAFAHAALAAGCGMFAGYPGTPSSEVIETVARLHADGAAEGIHVEWSTNEKAALEVVAAASMSGVRSLVTCKQVGLNVASDALMSLNYVGVKGGLVIFVADDPGPISSQTEQDTRRFAAFAKVPVFDPATPEQGAAMIGPAFEMSERYQTPVIFRPTTRIDHASTFFDFPETTTARPAIGGGFHRNPAEYVIFPPRAYQAHGQINERLRAISHDLMYEPDLMAFNPLFANTLPNGEPAPGIGKRPALRQEADREQTPAPAKLGIVTGGVSTQYAREALRILDRAAARSGHRLPPLRLLQIGTPYPFPTRVAARALKDLTDVLVLEELDSVIEEELQKMASTSFLWPRIHGKLTDEANTRGENSTEDAVQRIAAFLRESATGSANVPATGGTNSANSANAAITAADAPQMAPAELDGPTDILGNTPFAYPGELPPRPAVLCAGCPHRASFLAIKRALKQLGIKREDAVFTGDIGCYTLGNAMPLDAVDTCLCMGGGITMAQGIAATNADKKAIAFTGDSTFFASGMTGIVNAAYNNHDITICVLDNGTTAMTGLQPHPGTGLTLMGSESKPISIEAVLKAANIQQIIETNPLIPFAAEEAAVQALEFDGPSAVIFRSPCVWSKPFGTPARVNASKCIGCKKCVTQVGCPAIGFELGARGAKSGKRGQAVIDRSQCNGCGLCLPVCPVDAISQSLEIEPEPQPVRQSRLNRNAPPAERAAEIGEPAEERMREDERDLDAPANAGRGPQAGQARSASTQDSRAADHLASERLSSIRSEVPILPMGNPYASVDEFEDDALYEAMTARERGANELSARDGSQQRMVRRVIKPAGERRYYMKDAVQRSAAAAVFAYTPLGEASQAAQIALTANERDANAGRSGAGTQRARRGSRCDQPDYGGNSELSLDDLFSGDPEVAVEEVDDEPQAEEPRRDADEPLDEMDLNFDGVAFDLDDGARPAHRSRGRSSERGLRRVHPADDAEMEPPDATHADESEPAFEDAASARATANDPWQTPGPQGSLIPQGTPQNAPRSQAPRTRTQAQPGGVPRETRSLRSRFADYGRSTGADEGRNPWQGGRS